jgi:hypothetical protein
MELKDYLLLGSQLKHTLKMYRVGIEEFPDEQEPCFDSYVVGAWLGDGTSRCGQITTADVEIVSELQRRLEPYGMYIKAVAQKYQFSMTGDSRALIKALRKYDMIQNKHIPHHIKTGSQKTRLEVLAGLLDTDGYYHKNTYEITQKNKQLADDIVFVARSLGFLATIHEIEKSCTYKGEKKTGTYHRIHISGAGLENIPVVLDRKKAHPREQIKNALHYGFKVVPTGWGDYYGFTVDDNHRFLLGDFTVTHNTVTAMGIMAAFWSSGLKICFVTTRDNQKNNPVSEYAKNCLCFYPDYVPLIFAGVPLPPKEFWNNSSYRSNNTFQLPDKRKMTFKEWCASIGGQIISQKLVTGGPMSFWQFAGKTKKIDFMKTGAVVIMDESQNVFKPKSTGGETEALNYCAKHMPTEAYMKHSYVFPLTATPGDTVGQVINMIDMVRPWGMPTITPQQFLANPGIVRGLYSYADIRGDKTHYGTLDSGIPINKFVPLEPRYFAAMMVEMKGYKEERDLDSNPDASKNFFIKSLAASCAIKLTSLAPLLGDEKDSMLQGKGTRAVLGFSTKMEAIFKTMETIQGCQYLYVPNADILQATVDVLTKKFGYERVQEGKGMLTSRTSGKDKVWDVHLADKPHKKRLYAFYMGAMQGVKGDEKQMKSVLDFFKSTNNKHGEHIKLFIGTVFEGLDMGWLQAVHLAAPLPSTADDDQAVGRALRYCGHDPGAKIVKVYRWFGTAPKTLEVNAKPAKQAAIDQGLEMLAEYDERGVNVHVHKDALRRGKPMRDFMMCIRAQAIECEANSHGGGILAALQYGDKTRCHVTKCNVQLDGKGNLVVDKHASGKHGNKNMNQKHLFKKGMKQQGGGGRGGMFGNLFGRKKSPGVGSPGRQKIVMGKKQQQQQQQQQQQRGRGAFLRFGNLFGRQQRQGGKLIGKHAPQLPPRPQKTTTGVLGIATPHQQMVMRRQTPSRQTSRQTPSRQTSRQTPTRQTSRQQTPTRQTSRQQTPTRQTSRQQTPTRQTSRQQTPTRRQTPTRQTSNPKYPKIPVGLLS